MKLGENDKEDKGMGLDDEAPISCQKELSYNWLVRILLFRVRQPVVRPRYWRGLYEGWYTRGRDFRCRPRDGGMSGRDTIGCGFSPIEQGTCIRRMHREAV